MKFELGFASLAVQRLLSQKPRAMKLAIVLPALLGVCATALVGVALAAAPARGAGNRGGVAGANAGNDTRVNRSFDNNYRDRNTTVISGGGYGGGGGGGYGYGGYGSSTAAEGYAHGMSDVIRSQGEYNLLTAQAASENEVARQRYIQNREEATRTYFEMRAMNKAYRAQEAATPEAPAREDGSMARTSGGRHPMPSQLDQLTGDITWPRTLMAESFDEERATIDELFHRRAQSTSGLDDESYRQLVDATARMGQKLDRNRDIVPAGDLRGLKNFVRNLQYEAGFPPS